MITQAFRHRPSPAMVVASIALIVALTGTSYAALKLPRNSVGTKQLRKNAVTSSKVKDGALRARDFRAADLSALRGARGPAGPAGAKGDQGDAGRSALTPLRSGESITGGFALEGQVPAGGGILGTWVAFPVAAPVALDSAHVLAVGPNGGSVCKGTVAAPTAPAGYACAYVGDQTAGGVGASEPAGTAGEAAKRGFLVNIGASAGGGVLVSGAWAYTAP